ncbi:hypothetical protein L1887_53565 [Cichorium endivia]|nr:hypothetical protein L1887_53565 [Cichorium endivia]
MQFSHTHLNSRPSARARMLPLLNASSLGPPAIAARSFHHMSGPVCRSIHATPLAFASVVPPIGQSCPTANPPPFTLGPRISSPQIIPAFLPDLGLSLSRPSLSTLSTLPTLSTRGDHCATMLSHAYTPRRIHNDYFGIDVGLRGNWLLTVITASCAAGFLLVGYDNGVMGGVVGLGEFNKTFNNPDANTIGNIVSLYEIGCFFGALSTFVIGDFLGRRRTILLSSLIMIAGAIIQAASSSVGVMILGRIVSGLGMGAINSTVPIMQAETSPAVSRGKLVCLDLTVLNFGIVISYWTDYAFGFSGLTGSKIWRIPIALQCVFIVVLMACTLVIPDTPRWLASKGREAEAIAVLERLHNASIDSPEVQQSFAGIQQAIQHERAAANTGWRALVANDNIQTRKRLFLACFIQAAQQLSGINALIYYSGTLFSQRGRYACGCERDRWQRELAIRCWQRRVRAGCDRRR